MLNWGVLSVGPRNHNSRPNFSKKISSEIIQMEKHTYLYLSHKGLMPIFFSPNCSFSVCGTAAVVAAAVVAAVAVAAVVGDGVNGSFTDWH